MSSWSVRRTYLMGVVAAVASLGLFVPTANSQSGRDLDAAGNEQRLQARVARLETRLSELEARLQMLEPGERASRSSTNVKRQSGAVSKKQDDHCASPSYLDDSGLRRVRQECAQGNSLGNCETPFVMDTDGIKRVKPDCL